MEIRNKKGQFTTGAIKENNFNWRGGLIEVHCSFCDKLLFRHPHRLKRTKNHFCNTKCKGGWQSTNSEFKRENHPRWNGGKITDKSGYIQIYIPGHHRAKHNKYVCEHILVAEKKYNRKILVGEHIHHINGIKNDNRPENLVVTTNSEHDKFSYIHDLQKRIRELEESQKYSAGITSNQLLNS